MKKSNAEVKEFKLRAEWCACEEVDFEYIVPKETDGECDCGIHKHHYHCGDCGGVVQIG